MFSLNLAYSLQDKDSHFAFAGGGGDCNDGKSATRKKRNKKEEEEAVVQWLVKRGTSFGSHNVQ